MRSYRIQHYRITLLGQPGTKLMVPTTAAEELGLRHAIPQSKLNKVWRVLRAVPNTLPGDHKERCKLLEVKLHTGDVFQVAEVVRDMAWRRDRGRPGRRTEQRRGPDSRQVGGKPVIDDHELTP